MVLNEFLKGKHVILRPVEEKDAEFILMIRLDERNAPFLGNTPNDIEFQKEWIRNQRERPGDYYFLYEDYDGNSQGVISVYNIHDNQAEVGRQVGLDDSLKNMEAEYLAMKFAFEKLNLEKIIGTTYVTNKRIYSKSKKLGLSVDGIINLNGRDSYLMSLTKSQFLNKWKPTMEFYLNKFDNTI